MVHLKSKRGVALPTAIAVTAILIILTTSLIFIAMNSVSNTTSDTSTRQAYINAKSALNYAASYYNSGAAFPASGATEYIVMEDSGGTGLSGASVKTVEADAESYNTFVEATYIPRTTPSDQDKLKLTAYAQSSDAWGGKAKTVRLTATYNIKNEASLPKRITSIVAKNGPTVNIDPPDDTITLNVRKHPDYDFVPYFYTWTYKDSNGTSTGAGGEGYYYGTDSTSIGETHSRFSGDAYKVKVLEGGTTLTPSGIWNTDPTNQGPQGISTQKSGTTDWYQHTYTIAKDSVNYFNAIISRNGGMLEQTGGSIHNTNHIQSCEMFHLWYADPADKNIYFEILDEDFYYYYSTDWNGKTNLENYFLVYTSRPATIVHTKVIHSRGNSIEDNSANPTISALGSSASMKYEGCGWWTSLVETNSYFTATITVGSKSYSVNTTQGEDKEVWIVIDKSKDSAIARTTESNANTYMGIDDDSYVTVKAKAYKGTSATSPTLKYRIDSIDSSTAKRNLLNRIMEAMDYVESDYTAESYEPLKTAIDQATVLYNDTTLYTDDVYEAKTTALETAIDNLVVNVCDVETMNQLRTKYNNIYKTYVKFEEGGTWVDAGAEKNYDRDAYAKLVEILDYANKILEAENPITVRDALGNIVTKSDGTVVTADGRKIQKSVVLNAIDALDYMVNYVELPENKLDRAPLHDKLQQSNEIVGNTDYTAESRTALQAQIDIAQAVYDNKSLKQSELNDAYSALDAKYQAALATKVTILDMAQLTANLATASTILTAEKKDCTDETYNALQTEYTSAMTVKDTATNQEAIDTANAALETALNNFYVYKPYTSTDLYEENVVRVWLDASAILEGDSFESATEAGLSVSVMKDDGEASIVDVIWDSSSKYYYFEINKTLYNKAQITFVEGTASFVSSKFDITNQNDILVIQNTTDDNKLNVIQKKLVTLYVSDETNDYDFFTPAVEITKADGNKETIVCTAEPGAPKHYYYCRFILDQNGTAAMPVSIYQKSDMTGVTCGINLLEGGEHIVFFKAGGSVTTLKANTVYPKASTSTPVTAPTVGGTSMLYSSNSSFSLEPQTFSTVNKGFDIAKLATTTQPITVTPSAGEVLIWFRVTGVSGLSGAPRLYAYCAGTSPVDELTSWDSRHSMIKYDDEHYYMTLDDKYTHVVITVSGSNKLNGVENIKLKVDSSTGKPYAYQTIDKNTGSNVATASNTAPTVTVSYTSGDLTGSVTEVSMAFVGGKYYELTNKSYAETFGSGNGGYIYDSSKFGGYWNGYSNSSCQGRVGDTEATVMYDWYEFKIPVDSGNQYSIQIKGLGGGSTWTDSAQNIWGDSWVVLNSDAKSGGRYSDVSLYSFDPNDSQVSEDVTVYFKIPTGTSETWSNIKLSTVGMGASTISLASDSNAQSMGYNYYSTTVASSSPYLKFEATVTDASGATRVKQYTTALQGGDYVLFDPLMNLGNGGWDTFVPPPVQLRREVVESISTYFGKVLPTSYDAYGFANGEYKKPLAFNSYISGYMNSVNDVDDSKIPSSWAEAEIKYETLHEARMAVENLYSVMSSARSYISGRNYPEYLNRGTLATYDIASVDLVTKYDTAVDKYTASGMSLDEFRTQTSILKTTIANVSVTSQNSAIAVFGDVQGKTSSSPVQISYSLTSGGSKITATVDQVNTENYPIYFISLPAGSDTAYDVTFMVNGVETEKQNIKVDEAYVYLDYSGNAYWAKNATSGYVEVKTDTITQQGSSPYNVKFEDSGSGYMTLYFDYDTTVKYKSGSVDKTYKIYAGAYEFMKTTSLTSTAAVVDKYGAATPFVMDSSGNISMNLFSDTAKTYFETSKTFGQYEGELSAESLGWVNSSGELTVNNGTVAQKVNITANKANFNGSFGSTEGLYFRWTGSEEITISRTFTLAAPEIRLALPTGVYGDNSRMRHFYLSASDLTADEVNVTFLSDVEVSYTDIYGLPHSFIIREGEYKLEKADSSLDPGVIADLFDETYWKSDKVTLLNGTEVSGGSGGTGKLDTDNIDYDN